MQRVILTVFGLITLTGLISLSGCGGASTRVAAPEVGAIEITVRFPESSRLIPANTRAVKVSIHQRGALFGQALLTREEGTARRQFSSMPVGTYTLIATAHPDANGAGVPTARGAMEVTVRPNETARVVLTLASTVERLQVVRADSTPLAPGVTTELRAIGLNAQNEVVLLSEGKQRWSSSNPSVATVNEAGMVTVLSPGRTTIRVYDEESEREGSLDLTVSPAGGGSSGGGTGTALAPGEWIVLSRMITPETAQLTALPPNDPNAAVLLPPPPPSTQGDKYVAYGTGSEYLVFVRIYSNSSNTLMSFNWRTGALVELASGLIWPIFDTDGETVVFAMNRGNQWDLYEVRVDGGGLRPLTQTPESEYDPALSPDGRRVVFTRNHRLMELERASGNVSALPTTGYELAFFPQYTPNGNHIVFIGRQAGRVGLHAMLNRAAPRTLATNVVRFALTPDSRVLYTVLNDSGMWLANIDGSNNRRVTSLSPKLGFAISPSGARAVVCDSAFGVRIVELSTGADTPLLSGTHTLPIWVSLNTRSGGVSASTPALDILRDWARAIPMPDAYAELLQTAW